MKDGMIMIIITILQPLLLFGVYLTLSLLLPIQVGSVKRDKAEPFTGQTTLISDPPTPSCRKLEPIPPPPPPPPPPPK